MPTNKIVVYEGGGYDGCFWEPNAFLFDWEGMVVDLRSTGRAGIGEDDVKALAKYHEIRTGNGGRAEAIYDMFAAKRMRALCDDYAAYHAAQFVLAAIESYDNAPENVRNRLKLAFYCAKCHKPVTGEENGLEYELHFVNMQSFGGIMIATTEAVCDECFDIGACQVCREQGDRDSDCYSPEQTALNGGLCDYHYDYDIVRLLSEHQIRPVGVGAELVELYRAIELGHRQYETLCKRRCVHFDRALQDQIKVGRGKVESEIVELWKTLDRNERQALTDVWALRDRPRKAQPILPGFKCDSDWLSSRTYR